MKRHLAQVVWALTLILPAFADGAEREERGLTKPPGGLINILDGNQVAAIYRCGPEVAKPYFWPLNARGDIPLTRAWPMEKAPRGGSTDHPHQKSAWFCHGDVIPEGVKLNQHIKGVAGVDFWSETKGHGRIVCKGERVSERDGGVKEKTGYATVTTENEWQTTDGTKLLDEIRVIQAYVLGKSRLLVLSIDLHASVCPITFGDTKEGSFGVRVNDVIREQGGKGKIENADGKVTEKNCWGRISDWCDYSGPIDGKTVGIAILADPKNPYPTCWHVRGYGLMAANPFGRDKSGFPAMKGKTDLVKLAKGEHLKLRYGLLIHPGDAKEGKVAEHYQKFVDLGKK